METINCRADIAGNIGYAVHARNFFKALDKLAPICLLPKQGRLPDLAVHDYLHPMLQRLNTMDLNAITINLDYPGIDIGFCSGRKKVAYTVFESQLLSPIAVNMFNQLDQVWVPTQWGRQIMIQNGIKPDIIKVVPEGANTQTFDKSDDKFEQLTSLDAFRFVSVGKWEERKGVRDILLAFDEAFGKDDKVVLVTYFMSEVSALQNTKVEDEINKMKLRNRKKIIVINSALPQEIDMAKLYNSCHAYVSAAKAEGWGLPVMEAMSCGLPVIAPFYSGPTEYLTPENSYPLTVNELEDVYCPVFFPIKGQYGKWAKIDRPQLVAQMQQLYKNQEEAKARGMVAYEDVRKKWTWDHAAQTALSHLQELGLR